MNKSTTFFSYCFADKTCALSLNISGNGVLPPVVPSSFLDPNLVREHYGVPTTLVATNTSQSVAAFMWQFFSPTDLSQFFKQFGLPSYTVQKILGPNDQVPGYLEEGSLDVQYIMGVGQGVDTWYWSMTGKSWIAEWAQAVLSTPDGTFFHASISIYSPLYLLSPLSTLPSIHSQNSPMGPFHIIRILRIFHVTRLLLSTLSTQHSIYSPLHPLPPPSYLFTLSSQNSPMGAFHILRSIRVFHVTRLHGSF
jgi:hypothetical protein